MSNAGPTTLAGTRHDVAGADLLNELSVARPAIRQDLERFVRLLGEWQRVHNLVAPSTLADVWTRHIADSLQLIEHAPPDWREWVDLGSGAGFPGLVVAIASNGRPDRHVTLVESNSKKAAFLRAAIRETGANATIANERIEAHAPKFGRRADVVSARALAPLSGLLALAKPYAHGNTVMLFLKGSEYVHEIEAASQSFDFDVVDSPSATDSAGRVLAFRNIRAKESGDD
jgi:16S rRNA (guanine527-N7)-methyltransferase